jgi:hypothetical protein
MIGRLRFITHSVNVYTDGSRNFYVCPLLSIKPPDTCRFAWSQSCEEFVNMAHLQHYSNLATTQIYCSTSCTLLFTGCLSKECVLANFRGLFEYGRLLVKTYVWLRNMFGKLYGYVVYGTQRRLTCSKKTYNFTNPHQPEIHIYEKQ